MRRPDHRGSAPPQWLLDRLAARLPDLARYPGDDDVHRAQDAANRSSSHCGGRLCRTLTAKSSIPGATA
ncbi:hypothetical protein MAHJHV63_55150 [Mycobacterium avium subsp. hominissuis]